MRYYVNRFLAMAAIVVLVELGVGSDLAISQDSEQVPEGLAGVPSFRPSGGEEFAPDRILVKLKQGVPDRALEALNRQNNASIEKKLPHTRVDVVRLPRELPVEVAVKRYEASPDVEYAEPDFVFEPSQSTSANDLSYPKLYGLNNTGQTGGTSGADINAPEAWSTTTGDARVVVAVIDTIRGQAADARRAAR